MYNSFDTQEHVEENPGLQDWEDMKALQQIETVVCDDRNAWIGENTMDVDELTVKHIGQRFRIDWNTAGGWRSVVGNLNMCGPNFIGLVVVTEFVVGRPKGHHHSIPKTSITLVERV